MHARPQQNTDSKTRRVAKKTEGSAPELGHLSTHSDTRLIVQRKAGCTCGGGCPSCMEDDLALQPKLQVNQPNDRFEQEADRVAERVVGMQDAASSPVVVSDATTNLSAKSDSGLQVNAGTASEISALRGNGQPMPANDRAFFEPRFGTDFSDVRIHTGSKAAQTAQSINARAFTTGNDIVFGASEYAPGTAEGRRLMAHELTHTIQQTGQSNTVQREPLFPDDTCEDVDVNIRAAWEPAKRWAQHARSRLSDPESVSSALQRHFKINPTNEDHASDLDTVRTVFNDLVLLFDRDIDNVCVPANSGERCTLGDGRSFGAWVRSGRPEDGITWCLTGSATSGFLSQAALMRLLIHEMAHLADSDSDDFAYEDTSIVTTYANMTRAQAIHNGDSYAGFARDVFMGPRTSVPGLGLGLSTGALLSAGQPQWFIRPSLNYRSRTGLEVFDLVGGIHYIFGLNPGATGDQNVLSTAGITIDIGVLSRSPETNFFADVRTGFWASYDLDSETGSLGPTLNTTIGWANGGFSGGVNLQLLFDVLNENHAALIGGQFSFDFL